MHPQQTLLPVATLHAQLHALTLLGLDDQKIRARVGELPSEPDALVPVQKYLDMWTSAEALYGRPGLPTALAMAIPFGAFGAIDYLAASAETVAGCVESLILHLSMVSNDTQLEHDILDDGTHALTVRGTGEFPAAAFEFVLAVLVNRLRYLTNGSFPLLRIGLPIAKPEVDSIRASMLGQSIVYDYPTASMYFDAAGWELPMVRADPYLFATLKRVAVQLHLAHKGDSDLERALRLRLRDALAKRHAAPERMALLLGMSERTLQRRLAELGRSFSSIVEDFRREEAARLLCDPHQTLVRVADQLGYSEQTSFIRAFRRWTGSTPGAWRMENRL